MQTNEYGIQAILYPMLVDKNIQTCLLIGRQKATNQSETISKYPSKLTLILTCIVLNRLGRCVTDAWIKDIESTVSRIQCFAKANGRTSCMILQTYFAFVVHNLHLFHWLRYFISNLFLFWLIHKTYISYFSCDQAALRTLLSVCLSDRPSICHTFFTMFPSSYHPKIFRSYYH